MENENKHSLLEKSSQDTLYSHIHTYIYIYIYIYVYMCAYTYVQFVNELQLTCKELRTVNIQANTLDSWLTASRPNTHVIPSKGSSITVLFKIVLQMYKHT